jgi:hypothetical protein
MAVLRDTLLVYDAVALMYAVDNATVFAGDLHFPPLGAPMPR